MIEANKTSRSTGFGPYRGSISGGSKGGDELNCITGGQYGTQEAEEDYSLSHYYEKRASC